MKICVNAKCGDMFNMTIHDNNGNEILFKEGSVPSKLNIGGGDYIHFDIDNETGKIIGWVPLTDEEIQEINQEY